MKKKLLIMMLTAAFSVLPGSTSNAEEVEVDENELYMLSHVICGEAEGCSSIMKEYVGAVVLNRVEDDRFPDTIEEVIFQPGQYACTWDGNYYREPSEETIQVALTLLTEGTEIDKSVVWQANFVQGSGVYDTLKSPWGSTMYFCY